MRRDAVAVLLFASLGCSLPRSGDGETVAAGPPGAGGGGGGTSVGGASARSCGDGQKNGDETDIDCGGPCKACGFGRVCKIDTDCRVRCQDGLCIPAPRPVWEQRKVSPPTGGRFGFALAYDRKVQRTLLFGGVLPNVALYGDLWKFDGAAWTGGPPGPGARFNAGFAFDSARGKSVLYGGDNSFLIADTWEFDGTSGAWSPVLAPGPGARTGHAMAYDIARGVTVLFGGNVGKVANDTWTWDGSAWAPKSPKTPPPARVNAMMAFDDLRKVCVLFGGTAADGTTALGDTWEWNGTQWNERTSIVAPAPRSASAMAYDEARKRVVLFGGLTPGAVYGDTWEYDGVAWSLVNANGPPAGFLNAMVYDSARKRTTLYLGFSGVGYPSQTWDYYALATPCSEPTDCGSGFCVDGLCCASSCGAGEACDTPSSPGSCAPTSP